MTCVTKAAGTTKSFIQRLYLDKLGLFTASDDGLGNPVTIMNGNRLVGQVDEDNPPFSSVIGIDSARGIQDGESVFGSQATARTNLSLITSGQRDIKAGGDKGALQRCQGNGGVKVGGEVEPS